MPAKTELNSPAVSKVETKPLPVEQTPPVPSTKPPPVIEEKPKTEAEKKAEVKAASETEAMKRWKPALAKKVTAEMAPKTDAEAPPVAPAPPPEPPRAPEPTNEAPKEPEAPKPTPRARTARPGIGLDEVARVAAEAATRAVTAIQPPKVSPAESDPLEGLTPKQRRDVERARAIEVKFPEEYAGLSQRMVPYLKAKDELEAARVKAVKEAGRDRDLVDQINDDYAAKGDELQERHRTSYDAEDAIDALADARAKSADARVQQIQQELAQEKATRHLERVLPAVKTAAKTAAQHAAEQIAGSKVIIGDDGSIASDEYVALDPDKARFAEEAAIQIHGYAAGVYAVWQGIANDSAKQRVLAEVHDTEGYISQQGEDYERDLDPSGQGRRFTTIADYARMTPAQQARVWILSPEMLIERQREAVVTRATARITALTDARKGRKPTKVEARPPAEGGPAITNSVPPPAQTGTTPAPQSSHPVARWKSPKLAALVKDIPVTS